MSTTNLLEMFRDTAIKAHVGFKHEGPWEECQWIECEDRKKVIVREAAGHSWSDEFPQGAETFYWIRHKQNHADLNVGLLRDGTLLLAEGTTHGKSRRKDFEYLPASPSDFEQLIQLRKEVVDLRVDRQAVRALYDLPNEGDFYEQMADYLEYDTVDKVRLQNAVWNLLTETFYEEGLKNNGVAVKFLMRLHLLACEAGLPEYSKDNPIVAEALAALGDPATNSPESLAAAGRRREALAHTEESSRE